MDFNNFIQRGESVMYRVDIRHDDFDMDRDPFSVRLTTGFRGDHILIRKEEMSTDGKGGYFFGFNTSDMIGQVKAECFYHISDPDFPGGYRAYADKQTLCAVRTEPLEPYHPERGEPGSERHRHVSYTRVHLVHEYLTAAGAPLRVHGHPVAVNRTDTTYKS